MGLFDDLRRSIPWGTFAQVMSQNLGAGTLAAHEVVEQLKEWGSHLTMNALTKWTMATMNPVPCASPDVSRGRPEQCSAVAVVSCDVCGRPCCLAHSRLDYAGDAICEVCIGEAKARWRASGRTYEHVHAPPPPAPSPPGGLSVAQALKVLKLPKTATWDQIRRAHRKLVFKYNADRPQSDKERAASTEKLKRINVAFEVLRAAYERKAAA